MHSKYDISLFIENVKNGDAYGKMNGFLVAIATNEISNQTE